MLHGMKDMEGYTISASDGVLGRVTDFYFDDESWVVRYFVVAIEADAGRKVLISPISVEEPNWAGTTIPVSLTRAQVRACPNIDTDKPVSRQQEMGYLGYYGYGAYWGGGGLWGAGLYPDILQAGMQKNAAGTHNAGHRPEDPHLRSGNAIMRYYVHASDGDIGHVNGILLEDETWAIRYLIIDTSNWWLGHQVLVAPTWIADVSWSECTVSVDMTRQAVKDSPPYDRATVLDRDREAGIHAHYGRKGYWLEEGKSRAGRAGTVDSRAKTRASSSVR